MTVQNLGGHGILQDHAQSSHTGLSVSNAKYSGIWVQDSVSESGPALTLRGTSRVSGNQGSGLVFLESTGLSVSDTTLAGSIPLETSLQMDATMDVSDGLHLQAATGEISLDNLRVEGNERVGILLCGGTDQVIPDNISMTDVQITVPNGDAAGLFTQNGITLSMPGGSMTIREKQRRSKWLR